MTTAIVVAAWVAAAFWLVSALRSWRAVATMPRLPALDQPRLAGRRVSIIVPARDEEARVEEAILRLLAQRGIDTEIVAVNDRSRDATSAILDRLAAEHPRLRVIHVTDLPPGWLGKCHALHRAAAHASGDWLLFMDADAHLEPDAVARAVQGAIDHDAAHVGLLFGLAPSTFAARACMSAFLASFAERMGAVNRDRRRAFVGVGAFNLVRADVYRAFGGHETLRLEVLDDLGVGLCVRKLGERSRMLWAVRDIEVDFTPTLPMVFRVVEKNGFAAFRFNTPFLLGAVTLIFALWIAAVAGPAVTILTGSPGGALAFLGLALTAATGVRIALARGVSPLAALCGPLFVPVLASVFLRSWLVTLRRGGVRWRDTFYPLNDLRAALLSWRIPDNSIRRSPDGAPGVLPSQPARQSSV